MRVFLGLIVAVFLQAAMAVFESGAQTATPMPDPDSRAPILPRAELAASLLRRGRGLLIWDVRERVEYDVSHLPTAWLVAPSAGVEPILARFKNRVPKATIVVYCTTGQRSQTFADAALHALIEAGAHRVTVLDDGISAWANDRRPMLGATGPTRRVHPGPMPTDATAAPR